MFVLRNKCTCTWLRGVCVGLCVCVCGNNKQDQNSRVFTAYGKPAGLLLSFPLKTSAVWEGMILGLGNFF